MIRKLLAIALTTAACTGGAVDATSVDEIPATNPEQFTAHLVGLDKPAVVNVWASWCPPCRSEAPLLGEAFEAYGDDVEFIGIDVQDSQPEARAFIAEYGLAFDHFFDRNRSIPDFYGGIGTPITIFIEPGGEVFAIHNGVLDERTLALNIDELLRLEN